MHVVIAPIRIFSDWPIVEIICVATYNSVGFYFVLFDEKCTERVKRNQVFVCLMK